MSKIPYQMAKRGSFTWIKYNDYEFVHALGIPTPMGGGGWGELV